MTKKIRTSKWLSKIVGKKFRGKAEKLTRKIPQEGGYRTLGTCQAFQRRRRGRPKPRWGKRVLQQKERGSIGINERLIYALMESLKTSRGKVVTKKGKVRGKR